MSAPESAAVATDPVAELARQIYIALTSRIYSGIGGAEAGLPQPQALAQLSFRLAVAFYAEDRDANPVTLAAAAAARVPTRFDAADLDLGSLHQRR
jgi:hypothetical protein